MKNKLRVLQLIDSLRPGGAERMAINYANALVGRTEASFLCCTRMEGSLKNKISSEVVYLFLNRKGTYDLKAIIRLRNFVRQNQINFIHAHSSSIFLAILVKKTLPGIKIIWHNHFGRRALENSSAGILKPASFFFDGVISANQQLKDWAEDHLLVSNSCFIRNFLSNSNDRNSSKLLGGSSLKIICVANFRPEKDHLNLIRAFSILKEIKRDLSLHLIGGGQQGDYFNDIERKIFELDLKDRTYIYGESDGVVGLMENADIAVLSSSSEGLPLALLEYGRASLPVVCTDVGEVKAVLGNNGILVPPKNFEALAEGMKVYINSKEKRINDGEKFNEKVMAAFSEQAVMPEVLEFYESI